MPRLVARSVLTVFGPPDTIAEVSRNLSTISNCNMYTGEGNDVGTVLLTDEVTGMSVRILQQIGKGGEPGVQQQPIIPNSP